ncbi:MAG: GNAT family N-acetyltransferase [Lachnospiraceae bacterium]|nr:GNAT family N-acetyltransferase [Lachnospiraceae bacterium]
MILSGIGTENAEGFTAVIPPELVRDEDKLAVGVVEDDKAVAAALFSTDEDAAILEYLYVLPEYRRRGVGSFLLKESLSALDLDLVQAAFSDDTEGMLPFFEKLGFMMIEDTDVISIPMKELRKRCNESPLFRKKTAVEASSIDTVLERKELLRLLLQEKLDTELISEGRFTEELSFVCKDDAGEIRALLLCDRFEDTLLLTLLLNRSQNTDHMLALFQAFLKATEAAEYDGCSLRFLPAELSVLHFSERLAGDALVKEGRMLTMIGRLGGR